MKKLISVSVGEIVLKGKNRKYFEDQLISKMRRALKDFQVNKIYKDIGKIYVDMEDEDIDEGIKILKNVFGIIYVTKVIKTSRELEDIKKGIDEILSEKDLSKERTFKIIASRADKSYPLTSPEINQILGAYVLKNFDNIKVDVHNPEIPIYVDIRTSGYVYSDRVRALGGMPMGTNGKGLVLLSGGIDSPVAAFMMGRRGIEINGVHFHSYPYTSERSEKKVIKLGELVSRFTGPMKIFSVNMLDVYKAISENCQEKNITIISRKFMMRIGKKISEKYGYDALITGDNLGQVASQTIKSLKIIDKTTDMLVFRPLISMDKQEIIDISEDIGTYETSIQPFDDSCTIFSPDHPNLNPTIKGIEKEEEKLDIEKLVNDAVENMKIIEID